MGACDLGRGRGRFVEILGNPSTCPHGNPIPGRSSVADGQRSLSEFATGDRVRIARITEQIEIDPDSLRYLSDHGLVPGADAQVREKAPDGTLTLELGSTARSRSARQSAASSTSFPPEGLSAPTGEPKWTAI